MPAADTQKGRKAKPRQQAPPSFPSYVPPKPGAVKAKPKAARTAPKFPSYVPPKPGATPAPSRTKLARAQEVAYHSQAGAVRRAAATQKTRGLGPGVAVRPSGHQQVLTQARINQARDQRQAQAARQTPKQLAASRIIERAYRSQGAAVKRAADPTIGRARATEQAYRSQGESVQTLAELQRAVARGQKATAKETYGGSHIGPLQITHKRPLTAPTGKYADINRRSFSALGKTPEQLAEVATALNDPDKKKRAKALKSVTGKELERRTAEISAPAQKLLDYSMRLNYATAGGTSALLRGKNVGEAASKGIKGQEHKTFSNVLREQGAPKLVAGPAGFVLDVATDPLTYATFGAEGVGRRTAVKAAEKAAKDAEARIAARAVEGGASKTEAEAIGKRAAERIHAHTLARVEAAAPAGKGVTVKFAGKEIPGIRRGTGAIARGTRAGARKATPRVVRAVPGKVRTGLRKTVRPMARPGNIQAGRQAEQFVAGRQSERRARAHVTSQEAKALTLARQVHDVIPAEHHAAVIDALERNRLGRLPASIRNDPAARGIVHDLRSAFQGAYREGRRSGAIQGDIRDYIHEFMTGTQTKKLRRSIKGEVSAQARRVEQLTKNEQRAAHRQAIAEEAAKGTVAREAAVATERARGAATKTAAVGTERAKREAALTTERARGTSRTQALKEQHAADIAYERAHAGARVSVAKPKPELKAPQADLAAAKKAADKASVTLRRAHGHLQRVLAKPTAQRRHVASAYGKVVRAERRAEESAATLTGARTALRGTRARVAGVAPAEHEALLSAIEAKGQRVKPAPIARTVHERVKPAKVETDAETRIRGQLGEIDRRLENLPGDHPGRQQLVNRAHRLEDDLASARAAKMGTVRGGARLENARAGYQSRADQLAAAKARHAAAAKIPDKSALESDKSYLERVASYAAAHDLPLVRSRAEKLLGEQPSDVARGYFPRDYEERVRKQLGLEPTAAGGAAYTRTGVPGKVGRITSSYKRAEQRRLSTVNPELEAAGGHQFSTNIPLVTVNHLKRTARAASQGRFHQELAAEGRSLKVTRGADGKVVQPTLHEGEQMYKLGHQGGQYGLHPVDTASMRSGQYVALPKVLVDEMQGALKQITEPLYGARGYDRATGGLKRLMTATFGFHIRNMISDVNQHYLASPGHRIAGNVAEGWKATGRASEQARVWRPTETKTTIKVAGKDEPIDEFLKGAVDEGVLDAGQIGRELAELGGEGAAHVGEVKTGKVRKIGQRLDRWMTNRENLMRLATYKAGRDKGLSRAEAADVTNLIHVDYGDLTEVERRALRRVFPFYTWTARSLPLVAKTMITNPGKYATLEKLREELAKTTSDKPWDQQLAGMTTAVKRQIPFVVGNKAIGFGLPVTLANELPTGLSPKSIVAFGEELSRFGAGMVNPLIRLPAEWHFGENAVTKGEIEKADRPLVAAPAWVGKLPAPLKKQLDVTPGFHDPRSGKTTMGWRGKADWGYDQLMLGFIGQAAAVAGSGRSQTTTPQALAALGGIRVDPLNKTLSTRAAQQTARTEKADLTRRLGILNQQGVNASNATPEYTRLRARYNEIDKRLNPPKAKATGGGWGGGSSGGGGWGGGSSSGGGWG